jgi:hypothetical protein
METDARCTEKEIEMIVKTKKAVLTAEQIQMVRSAMKAEEDGYYGQPCGQDGFSGFWIDGDPENEFFWRTCAGNVLGITADGYIFAEGRRHGIPWQFLRGVIDPREIPITEWDFGSSMTSTRHPAFSGAGESLIPDWHMKKD